MNRYKKSSADEILLEIKTVLEIRPTNGYKRVTAMINKNRKKKNFKKLNKK